MHYFVGSVIGYHHRRFDDEVALIYAAEAFEALKQFEKANAQQGEK